ncbi:GNAT family N-acetyltransferase [Clostridium sp.]|uniref:GNAT family N-acetyltransferase n=1 Tax=Clostridium sp. TaxID=1506 RepID=UPI00284439DA|nr:GNAT family N-acetyltransferase [Clostridium sp.]MDR3596363.1 GNAT family N-acetyltransferase [Clostridium sp.]
MIKRYLNLNGIEKSLVRNFINRKEENKKSLDEIEKIFNNKMYGYGKGSLFYFFNGQAVGKINIVLEVVKELGNIFIHHLDILEDLNIHTQEVIIKELIDNAITLAEDYKPKKILLGERNKNRLKILEGLGLHSEYKSLRMHLEDRSKKEKPLDLIPLSTENKFEYLSVYNDSFNDMPHGSYAYIDEVEEYLNKANEENYYFMVSVNNTNIGFMNCIIENRQGIFDIGLCKAYRGKGYGSRLLETAVNFLNRKDVRKINLIVIEKNSRAYNMYKKRGFKEESIISYWIKIK